jgi:hypothetical protein
MMRSFACFWEVGGSVGGHGPWGGGLHRDDRFLAAYDRLAVTAKSHASVTLAVLS